MNLALKGNFGFCQAEGSEECHNKSGENICAGIIKVMVGSDRRCSCEGRLGLTEEVLNIVKESRLFKNWQQLPIVGF